MILLLLLSVISAVLIVLALVDVARDGYRPVATRRVGDEVIGRYR